MAGLKCKFKQATSFYPCFALPLLIFPCIMSPMAILGIMLAAAALTLIGWVVLAVWIAKGPPPGLIG